MVGDIDFLVNKNESDKSYKILQELGYTNVVSILFEDHRHLPRIMHPNRIAAVEIHKEILRIEKSSFFNYDTIKSSLKPHPKNKFTFLSDENKLKLTIFSKMINDNEYFLKTINLRAANDFFLISSRLSKSIILKDKNLCNELNAGLELYSHILSKSKFINFTSDKNSKSFLNSCLKNLKTTQINIQKNRINKIIIYCKFRFKIIYYSFYKKSYYEFVLSKLSDINWLKRKLGIKSNT